MVQVAILWLLAANPETGEVVEGVAKNRWESSTRLAPLRLQTPRNWAMELGAGSFFPALHSGGLDLAPGESFRFAAAHPVPTPRVALERLVVDGVGSVFVGLSFAYVRAGGDLDLRGTFVGKGGGVLQIKDGVQGRLHVLPLAFNVSYRLDRPARAGRTIFVPYAKLGYARTWWFLEGGHVHFAGRFDGWTCGAGVALRLDALDPTAARHFDVDWGINHTSVFVEAAHQSTGSGRFDADRVLPRNVVYLAGLQFEF